MIATQVTEPAAVHGEGPVWFADDGLLCWLDMLAGDVLITDVASSQTDRWHVADAVAAVRPRRSGGVVVATGHQFGLADALGGDIELTAPMFEPGWSRFNDGCCDPAGNFLAGSMTESLIPQACSVYRLDQQGGTNVALEQVTASNGICWTPTADLVYYVDSALRTIDVFDSSARGELRNRRTFVAFERSEGIPDGLTVDADGGVWVAMWGAGNVRNYDPTGTLKSIVTVPTPYVTACTFAGRNLDQLFITTSRQPDATLENTGAGALFIAEPGVTGVTPLVYGG